MRLAVARNSMPSFPAVFDERARRLVPAQVGATLMHAYQLSGACIPETLGGRLMGLDLGTR